MRSKTMRDVIFFDLTTVHAHAQTRSKKKSIGAVVDIDDESCISNESTWLFFRVCACVFVFVFGVCVFEFLCAFVVYVHHHACLQASVD
jgi:hypothetical protein